MSTIDPSTSATLRKSMLIGFGAGLGALALNPYLGRSLSLLPIAGLSTTAKTSYLATFALGALPTTVVMMVHDKAREVMGRSSALHTRPKLSGVCLAFLDAASGTMTIGLVCWKTAVPFPAGAAISGMGITLVLIMRKILPLFKEHEASQDSAEQQKLKVDELHKRVSGLEKKMDEDKPAPPPPPDDQLKSKQEELEGKLKELQQNVQEEQRIQKEVVTQMRKVLDQLLQQHVDKRSQQEEVEKLQEAIKKLDENLSRRVAENKEDLQKELKEKMEKQQKAFEEEQQKILDLIQANEQKMDKKCAEIDEQLISKLTDLSDAIKQAAEDSATKLEEHKEELAQKVNSLLSETQQSIQVNEQEISKMAAENASFIQQADQNLKKQAQAYNSAKLRMEKQKELLDKVDKERSLRHEVIQQRYETILRGIAENKKVLKTMQELRPDVIQYAKNTDTTMKTWTQHSQSKFAEIGKKMDQIIEKAKQASRELTPWPTAVMEALQEIAGEFAAAVEEEPVKTPKTEPIKGGK